MAPAYFGVLAVCLVVPPLLIGRAQAAEIQVEFGATNGTIRPLHGVNMGPLCYRGTVDLSAYHRELGIPLTRLHDVVWLNAEAVDIHTVFPEFRNDPERAESYRFGPTDDYLQSILNAGSQIVYRLGESIEHTSRKYFVHPPANLEKWAAICLGIIRHYNEGWAEGFHHHIQYWEIWNEPDVRPAMWTGTEDQYFALYEVAAKAIKRGFPGVKVGGPALGGSGQIGPQGFKPSAFLTNFLAFCQARSVPLDFFSWHCYTSRPEELAARARAVRDYLGAHGFAGTESHLNEWNYLPNDDWRPMLRDGQGALRESWYQQMGGPHGAAFAANALILLQDAPLDAANFYTGEVQGFGLFSLAGVPKANFYAFKAFRLMLDTPVRVRATNSDRAVLALAGVDSARGKANLLLSSLHGTESQVTVALSHLPWKEATRYEVRALDGTPSLRLVQSGILPAGEAMLALNLVSPGLLLLQMSATAAP